MLSKSAIFTIAALAVAGASQAQSILPQKDNAPGQAQVAEPAAPALASKAKTAPAAATKTAAAPAAAAPVAAPSTPAPAPAPRPQVVVLSAAGSPAAQSGAITIAEIAANQAKALAAESAKKTLPPNSGITAQPMRPAQVVPEILPATSIPVVMNSDIKLAAAPARKVAPRPYLASIIGLKGLEQAEISTGDNLGASFKVGDSIGNWTIIRIAGGKLFVSSDEYSKKTRKTETKIRVLSVGDSL